MPGTQTADGKNDERETQGSKARCGENRRAEGLDLMDSDREVAGLIRAGLNADFQVTQHRARFERIPLPRAPHHVMPVGVSD